MSGLSGNDWLLFGGIALMGFSVLMMIPGILWAKIAKKRLNETLDQEYGPERHG